MKLSVCYMVKDEILKLPESIQRTREFVDEICVVDTGSTDGTMGYLRDVHTVKYSQYPWNDDFSAARNASLEMATGDWILVLDADEWIDPGVYPKIRGLMQGKHDAYLFTIAHFLQDPFWTVNPKIHYGIAIRLFRNLHPYRYVGLVHNKLEIENPENSKLMIYNFEYKEKDTVVEKQQQKRLLMDKKVKLEGWNFNNCVHYADTYRRTWTWMKSIQDARLAVEYLNKALVYQHSVEVVETRNHLLKEINNATIKNNNTGKKETVLGRVPSKTEVQGAGV